MAAVPVDLAGMASYATQIASVEEAETKVLEAMASGAVAVKEFKICGPRTKFGVGFFQFDVKILICIVVIPIVVFIIKSGRNGLEILGSDIFQSAPRFLLN